MVTLYYEIVFRMTIYIQQCSWFQGLALNSWIKQRNQRGDLFTELNRALNANSSCCIIINRKCFGAELPFNMVASVHFCLNLWNKMFCLSFDLQFNRYVTSFLLVSRNDQKHVCDYVFWSCLPYDYMEPRFNSGLSQETFAIHSWKLLTAF